MRRIVLACAVFLVCWATPPIHIQTTADGTPSDAQVYDGIVAQLRQGQPYYRSVGTALRRSQYATREIFNWRTPLLWSTLARTSTPVASGVLLTLCAILWIGTLWVTRGRRIVLAVAGILQLGAIVMAAVPRALVMGEAWSGILIGLSVLAASTGRKAGAIGLGLLALFMRELAAPYCVVMTLAAAWQRRWREFVAWLVGASLYFAYYAWHVANVLSQRRPSDLAQPSSWLEGGVVSLMTKAAWHGWLYSAPRWCVAAALAMIVAGIASRYSPTPVRLASSAYLVFFLIVGKAFDQYWGLMAWPVWAVACGYGADALCNDVLAAIAAIASSKKGLDPGPYIISPKRVGFLTSARKSYVE